jgi:hypothetical protein
LAAGALTLALARAGYITVNVDEWVFVVYEAEIALLSKVSKPKPKVSEIALREACSRRARNQAQAGPAQVQGEPARLIAFLLPYLHFFAVIFLIFIFVIVISC